MASGPPDVHPVISRAPALLTHLVICPWICLPPFTLLSGPCTQRGHPFGPLRLTAPVALTPGPGSGWPLTKRIGREHENRKPGLLNHLFPRSPLLL